MGGILPHRTGRGKDFVPRSGQDALGPTPHQTLDTRSRAFCLGSDIHGGSYWIPGAYAPALSEKQNAFLRLLKNKGFKEEVVYGNSADNSPHLKTESLNFSQFVARQHWLKSGVSPCGSRILVAVGVLDF